MKRRKNWIIMSVVAMLSLSGSVQLQAKTSLENFMEVCREVQREFESFQAQPNRYGARMLEKKIRGERRSKEPYLLGMLNELSPEEPEVVMDYLTIIVGEMDLKIEQYLIEEDFQEHFNAPVTKMPWNYIKALEYLKTRLKMLNRILRKDYLEDQLFTAFEGLPVKTLKALQRYPLLRSSFDAQIWSVFSNGLPAVINEGEYFIYQKIAPDATLKQLVCFINFATYEQTANLHDFSINQYADEAFQSFYQKSTLDGESSTLSYFKQVLVDGQRNSIWPVLFPLIAEQFAKDQRLATRAGALMNAPRVATEAEYEEVIRSMAPKEIAYVAVMKRVRPMLNAGQFAKATDLLRKYRLFFEGHTSTHSLSKIDAQIANLQELERVPPRKFEPIREWTNDGDEIAFTFNKNYTHALLIPFYPGEALRKYRREQNRFEAVNSSLKFYPWRFYEFEKINITEPDQEKEYMISQFFQNTSQLEAELIRDVFISRRFNIALMVTDSKQGRRETPPNEWVACPSEYASPGIVYRFRGFQEEKHGLGFHGKQHANINTDIFYSIYNPLSRTWSTPKLLEGEGRRIVNSPFAERSPFLSLDGTKLYFSSEGFNSQGGFDLFSIPIDISGGVIRIDGEPENMSAYNSPYDELFFQPLPIDTFVSSNRFSEGKHFDIARLKDYRSPTPQTEPNEAPLPYRPSSGTPIQLSKGVNIDAECLDLPERKMVPEGHIIIKGRIYQDNGELFPRAEIFFMTRSGYQDSDTINLSLGMDSVYMVVVPDNRAYMIQAYGYTASGDTITAYTDDFIFVCENRRKEKYVAYDAVLEPVSELEENGIATSVPFFFETNQTNPYALHDIESIRAYYQTFIRQFREKSDLIFLIEGYADERGTSSYNCDLSERRAKAVKSFLISELGFPANRLVTVGRGETRQFNAESIQSHLEYLEFDRLSADVQSHEWQLNRRATIRFISTQKDNLQISTKCP